MSSGFVSLTRFSDYSDLNTFFARVLVFWAGTYSSPSFSFYNLLKNFCACDLTWGQLLVLMKVAIFFQFRPCICIPELQRSYLLRTGCAIIVSISPCCWSCRSPSAANLPCDYRVGMEERKVKRQVGSYLTSRCPLSILYNGYQRVYKSMEE